MSISSINTPKHWYDRAAKMRSLSEAMNDIEARATMLRLVDDYGRLIDRVPVQRASTGPLSGLPSQATTPSGHGV
jgi:hypothetical protein